MKSRNWWLIAAVLITVTGLSFNFSGYDLLDPDEGRNAEVAREMAATNDYVLPRLNGLPYLDKPILFFFVDALGMEVLGPTVFAARLPALLFTIFTLALVWWFARKRVGRDEAWVAALATATMPLTLGFSRTVIFDSTLAFFVVLSIVAFFEAFHGSANEGNDDTPYWWTVVAWCGMALGVLTKGPIAIAVPLMVVIPFAAWRKTLRRVINPIALLSFAALLLPWIFAMQKRIPEFLEYSLVTETIARLTTDEMQRTGPIWYFLPIIIAGSLPWSAVALGALKKGTPGKSSEDRSLFVFLLLWILVPLVFFSLSQSKRPQYILPTLPAIGLLVALLWKGAPEKVGGIRAASIALALLAIVFFVVASALGEVFGASEAVAATIPATGIGLGAACLISAVVLWVFGDNRSLTLLALVLPVSVIPLASTRLMSAIGDDRSNANIAQVMNRVITDETEIIAIETFPLSLPFYLDRLVTLSTTTGAELTSNYLFRTLDDWRNIQGTTLRPPGWWRERVAVCDRPRLFVVKSHDQDTRQLLETALPLLTVNRKVAVYGPCDLVQLANTSGL